MILVLNFFSCLFLFRFWSISFSFIEEILQIPRKHCILHALPYWNEIKIQFEKNNKNWLTKQKKTHLKMEKILKGSLDSIPSPSPSVKIQWAGKFALGVKIKHCCALSTTFWKQMFCLIKVEIFLEQRQVAF